LHKKLLKQRGKFTITEIKSIFNDVALNLIANLKTKENYDITDLQNFDPIGGYAIYKGCQD
jgi:hypothetical protein